MEYIYVGKIVNTHGLKGEIRIISDFEYKKEIFKENFSIYIGKNYEKFEIKTYRVHKQYDMVTLNRIDTIESAIPYKGEAVYINKESIQIDGYFDEDIIGLDVYMNEKKVGKVKEIIKSNAYPILVLEERRGMIPYIPEFIQNIDIKKQSIILNPVEGLIYED